MAGISDGPGAADTRAPQARPDRLVTIPSNDAPFAAYARRALRHMRASPRALEARLRLRYPSAIVRPRALSGEPELVWYVYRDGWVLRTVRP